MEGVGHIDFFRWQSQLIVSSTSLNAHTFSYYHTITSHKISQQFAQIPQPFPARIGDPCPPSPHPVAVPMVLSDFSENQFWQLMCILQDLWWLYLSWNYKWCCHLWDKFAHKPLSSFGRWCPGFCCHGFSWLQLKGSWQTEWSCALVVASEVDMDSTV